MRETIIEDIIKLLEQVDISKLNIIKCFIEGIKK